MGSGIQALHDLFVRHPRELIEPSVIFALTLAIGLLVRRVILRALDLWHQRTKSRPGLILTESLRGPLVIWILILAVHFAIQSSELSSRYTRWTPRVLAALWIISLTLMCMRIAGELVRYYGGQIPGAMPVTTLTQTLAQLAVVVLGVLVLLNQLGISVTPMLTALGVGGLAVALALQDTLSNLFGGFYVAVAGQVRLGDYIRLNSGEEGFISDISWRSSTLRGASNNVIIIPNATMAKAVITNFNLPDKRIAVSIQ